MPELPDVEGFRRVLAEHAKGERVERVRVRDAGVVRATSPRRFDRAVRGHRFGSPRRHGKWLIAPTDGGPTVLLHFGMTGSLSWHDGREPEHRHDRVIFEFGGGELRYRDMRKLQGVRLAAGAAEVERALGELGPDALDVSRERFDELVMGRRGRLKSALTDQTVIAGLGNLLADEMCWHAEINPMRAARELDDAERARLYRAMRRVLRESVKDERVPPRRTWLTGVRDDPDAACPRCGTRLSRGRVAGRATLWCPRCQPA
ncbi:MAG TPA: DNA-formamidopyrimidine glycosylase family protein [Streptosporangiaceae bacterium]|nr:DNA-formamidopyrimidine glycosylase family protein [Streptosporangiaceae bacterium]